MLEFKGNCVSNGFAIGRIFRYVAPSYQPTKSNVKNVDAELEKYQNARTEAVQELKCLYEKASINADSESAMVFEVHQMMVDDDDFIDKVTAHIRDEHICAEYAVYEAGNELASFFESMEDEYMKARCADIQDITKRLIRILKGIKENGLNTTEPVILLAEDLSPSETVQLDKKQLLGFVTRGGSSNSHTAILARSMNLPAITNCNIELSEEYDNLYSVLDGSTGSLYINPDDASLQAFQKKEKAYKESLLSLRSYIGKENRTKDGRTVRIYGNAGSLSDADLALDNDAGGIGLFRSEFIYLGESNYPSEEKQFQIYKAIAEKMGSKEVIIRTLDIGADKQADYFNLDKEENPAMGYRAIRICLDRPEIFKTQLRAIYRASIYGNLSIMFPMIISLEEIHNIKDIVKDVTDSLTKENIPYKEIPLGIMIETPAAALISDKLAPFVDFFSIGTNDLTQYTLAIDRQNTKLDHYYDRHHEALLRLIKMTIDNAHHAGIWVGICGELGGDATLLDTFLSYGVDELSVSPGKILSLRKKLIEL